MRGGLYFRFLIASAKWSEGLPTDQAVANEYKGQDLPMPEPARPERLPTAALWGRDSAMDIASDLTRLRDATQHWRRRFAQLQEPVFEGGDSAAMKWIEALDDLALQRSAAADFVPPEGQIARAGCLVSAREIFDHISARFPDLPVGPRSNSTPRAWLRELDQAARQSIAPATNAGRAAAARGLIAARELYDAARRYHYCTPLPELAGRVTRAELLALFRQEGAFAVSPPESTLRHAPVTLTVTKACRSPSTSNDIGSVVRNGFCLMFREPAGLSDSPEARSASVAVQNLLAVGGLDSIVSPKATSADELTQVFAAFIEAARSRNLGGRPDVAALPRFLETLTALHSQEEKLDLLRFMSGLAMVRLDAGGELPDVETLLVQAWTDVLRVMEVHHAQAQGPDLVLVNRNETVSEVDRDDAARVLEVQQRWYASRRQPETLLAHLDRRDGGETIEPFTPFVAYLRYNAGDAIFMGILLRCLRQFPRLLARKRGAAAFRKALRDVQATWTFDERSYFTAVLRTLKRYERFWADRVRSVRREETAWRHVGLIAKLRQGSAPPWLPAAVEAGDPKQAATAALQVVDCLHRLRLFPVMMALLEQTRISELFAAVPGLSDRWRVIFARAHTFVALGKAFDEALQRVGASR